MTAFPVSARVTSLAGFDFLPGMGAEGYSESYKGYTIKERVGKGDYDVIDPSGTSIVAFNDYPITVPLARKLVVDTVAYYRVQADMKRDDEAKKTGGVYRGFVIMYNSNSRTYEVVTKDTAEKIAGGFINYTDAQKAIDKHILSMAPTVKEDETTRPAPETGNDVYGPQPAPKRPDWMNWIAPQQQPLPQQQQSPVDSRQPIYTVAQKKTNMLPIVIAGGAGLALLLLLKK